jgi:hypothetical protein
MFFADGDFQSTQLYDYGKSPAVPSVPPITGPEHPVINNIARIFYGQAQSRDPADDTMKDPCDLKKEDRLLAKRQHILTADPCLIEWPHANMADFGDGSSSDDKDKYNERYEHDRLSLAQWKLVKGSDYDTRIIPTCFTIRPLVDMGDPNTFHKLMCEGVGSFAIQWAYWDSVDGKFYWYPSRDPDGNGDPTDSHFLLICPVCDKKFGVFFNVPAPTISYFHWFAVDNPQVQYRSGSNFPAGFYLKALKFTFTLYDSKGVIKEGRTFTHIVYLGE